MTTKRGGSIMKIGLGQLDIIWEDKEKNKLSCSNMIAQAKQEGVDFIVFPEMTLTGFSMNPADLGETMEDSPSIAFFREEAMKHQIYIAFGIIIKNEDKAENHCIILSDTGEIIANYAKIHPFSYGAESKYYTGGTTLTSCAVKELVVSPLICYDLRFPEIFQACSENSSLITVIANWPAPRRAHWISLLKARAIENQCYIAGVNRCGEGGGLSYVGDSMVISPYGDIISTVQDTPGLIVAELDLELVEKYRSEFPLKADRKPCLYTKFYCPQRK
jgi:omega-amidase